MAEPRPGDLSGVGDVPCRQHAIDRVLERSGLVYEGRLARYAMFPNISTEPQDVLQYAKALR